MTIMLDRVTFAYGRVPVLREVSLTLPERGVVCLWGASGCGKTTVLRLLAGLERPQGGRVLRPERVSVMFQEDRLLPWRTAAENVSIAAGCPPEQATAWLRRLGIDGEQAGALPSALSGGQCRRAALARALAYESDLLLLDEPFTGMDEDSREAAAAPILARAAHVPVVLVTHVAAEAERLSAALVRMDKADGAPVSGVLRNG